MVNPNRIAKRTYEQAFRTLCHSSISSTDDFAGKSIGSNVLCAPDERDCWRLLERFNCKGVENRKFLLGSYEKWRTSNWPMVCALSIDTLAPKIKGNKKVKEERYEEAVSALRRFLKQFDQYHDEMDKTEVFYVLDTVFTKNRKDLNMEDVIRKVLNDIKISIDPEFVVCRGNSSVNEINGDLFSSPESLAHCVSQDLAMGAGIAKLFKQKFRRVDELHMQRKGVREVAFLSVNSRFIYYLVTKRRHFDKPTYADVRYSLVDMRRHALENGVTRISMPAIGCGLDKLDWDRMKLIIKEVFLSTNIDITIYFL